MYVTVAHEFRVPFDVDIEYRCANVDRNMFLTIFDEKREIVSSCFDEDNVPELKVVVDKEQLKENAIAIAKLLQKETYWHKEEGCSPENAMQLIDSLTTSYALTFRGEIVAFARLITDDYTSYLSDVAVAKEHQSRGFGTCLNNYIYENELVNFSVNALVRGADHRANATEKENEKYAQDAQCSEAIYKKMGYVYSDKEGEAHKVKKTNETVYFRYVKYNKNADSCIKFKFMKEDEKARENDIGRDAKGADFNTNV